MKTLNCYISILSQYLLILLVSTSAMAETFDYTCKIPDGWVSNKTSEGTVVGHNAIPGLIIISNHNQPDLAHMQNELQRGLQEDTLFLHLSGSLKKVNENILTGEYSGSMGADTVTGTGFGVLSPHGGGTYVLALALPNEMSKKLSDAAKQIALSVKFNKPSTSTSTKNPLIGTWKDIRGNGHTVITLAVNGTFSYYSDRSASGDGWGYTNNDESTGRWLAKGSAQTGTILYQTNTGEQGSMSYQVMIENSKVYWDEFYFDGSIYQRQ